MNVVSFYKVNNLVTHFLPLLILIIWKFTSCCCSHFENLVHVLFQKLMNPFSCDLETSKCIMYDFTNERFYHALYYGLYHGGRKWLTYFSHFLEHGNQGISKVLILFKYQHVVFGLLHGSPKLLCMNVIWF